MATVIPDLGLIRSVLAAFADADTDYPAPILTLWRRLTEALTEREAESLPGAIAAVTPLLAANPERLRLALDVVTTFDLVEVLPALSKLVSETHSADAALAAAWLSTNPAASGELVSAVQQAVNDAFLTERERVAIRIRMSPTATVSDDRGAQLRRQVWPGLGRPVAGAPPFVALEESAGRANVRLKFAGDLHEAGATLRRLPAAWAREPAPAWLGPDLIVVTWTDASVRRLRAADERISLGQFAFGPRDDSARARRHALGEVARRVHSGTRLRIPTEEQPEITADPLRPELYRLGAFDLREMIFLSGVSYSTLQRVRDELKPRFSEHSPFWSFNQLMALRTWQIFRARSGKRHFRTDVLKSLSEFAGAPETTRVGVTGGGEILLVADGRLVDLTSGQEAIADFIYLDQVFDPVELGQGRMPGLLDPSTHTRVNPAVLGGTPRIEGHRIAARTLARMADVHGTQAVLRAYPSLNEAHLVDGIRLGGELLRAA
jgi:uncharacterized protein (DUF433 family)